MSTPTDALIEKMARAVADLLEHENSPYQYAKIYGLNEVELDGSFNLLEIVRAAYEAEHEETKG